MRGVKIVGERRGRFDKSFGGFPTLTKSVRIGHRGEDGGDGKAGLAAMLLIWNVNRWAPARPPGMQPREQMFERQLLKP